MTSGNSALRYLVRSVIPVLSALAILTTTFLQSEQVEASPPVDGECGSTLNSCDAGSFVNSPDTPEEYRWQCRGANGGSNVTCAQCKPLGPSAERLPRCGQTLNSCSEGAFVNLADTDEDYRWQCVSDGGTAATCTKSKASSGQGGVVGRCGATTHTCEAGEARPLSSTAEEYRWQCLGGNGGIDTTCSKPRPVILESASPGKCGSRINTCDTGEFGNLPDTDQEYRWKCEADVDATCSKSKVDVPTRIAQFHLPDFPKPGSFLTVLVSAIGEDYQILDVKLIDLSQALSPVVVDNFVCEGPSSMCRHVFGTEVPGSVE